MAVALMFALPIAADDETHRQSEISNPESDAPVVISATRTAVFYRDVSSSATLISESEVKSLAFPLSTDALISVPGVDIRRSGPPGQPTSLFMRGTDSDHTKFMLDGIDISDPATPAGIPLLDHLFGPGTGQVEVIRGPQSTLYGSDAIGGVVNVITRTARSGSPTATLEFEGGSFATATQRLTVEGAGETVNAFLAFTHTESAGISASAAGSEPDPYRHSQLSTRVGFDVSDELFIDTVFHYISAQTEFDLFGADDPLNQTESEQFFAKVQPQLTLLDGRWVSKLNLNTGIQRRDTFDRFFIGDTYSFKHFDGAAYEADWQNDLRLADWNMLTIGGAVRHEDARATSVFGPAAGTADADRDVASFYLQDQITLFDRRVRIVPGIRHDRFSDFGDHTTWRIASSYHHVQTATTVRGSFGTAFNAPSLIDLFDPAFGNRMLEAERSRGWDIGVEQEFAKGRATIGATYFENDIDELIQFSFVTFLPENIGAAETSGVEVFGTFRPCDNITIRPSYTYTETQNTSTGARLLRRPLHKGGFDAIARLIDNRATVGLGVFYVGERDDVSVTTFDTVTNDDYWLVRLSASLKVTDNIDLIARVENLLDEDYQDVLGFNSPGVAAYGGVRILLP